MYQALYRKWRPRTFDEVVGQEHITETLKRQVATGRLSHAYLFTGTRGTGKTTCAKILARAVNCQNPVNGNPCNVCPACQGIENGSILDVLELDAASNNGVDQIRALRDEAAYTPAAVRKRVYIVDEVHMLSTAAFNALLKILEEPPAHLMFILATTELHKVPATIKSRCQQFAFKRISHRALAGRLAYVAKEEGIALTAPAADLLARLADGGLRDGLSLLDQCSGAEGELTEEVVLEVLGLTGNRRTAQLLDCVAREDTTGALTILDELYRDGKDMGALLGEIASLVRDLLLRKTAPDGGRGLLAGGYEEKTLRALTQQFTAAELVQMMTLLQAAQADLYRSTSRRVDTELCLIRLCDRRLSDTPEGVLSRLSRLEAQAAQGFPAAGAVPPAPPAEPVREAPAPQPAAEEEDEDEAPFVFDEAEDAPPWEVDPVPPPAPLRHHSLRRLPVCQYSRREGLPGRAFWPVWGTCPPWWPPSSTNRSRSPAPLRNIPLPSGRIRSSPRASSAGAGPPLCWSRRQRPSPAKSAGWCSRWAGQTPSRSLQQGKGRTILKTCWPWASSLGTLR